MALFIRQDERKSELQSRIAMELQERAKSRAKTNNIPDGVDDSEYMSSTKKTTSLAWVWVIIVLAFVGIVIWLMMLNIATK